MCNDQIDVEHNVGFLSLERIHPTNLQKNE